MADAREQLEGIITRVNEKNPYFLVGGIIFLILLVDYFAIMQFQLKTLNKINPEITTLSEDYQTTEDNMQKLPQHQQDLESLRKDLEFINRKIRSKEEVPLILENISRMAAHHNVKVVEMMPDRSDEETILETDEGDYISIPIKIVLRAGYHDFGRFLTQLQNEEIFLRIPEFTVSSSMNDSLTHNIDLQTKAIIFEKD